VNGPEVRRIVTGENDGLGVFAAVETVTPVVNKAGSAYWPIFGSDEITRIPTDGSPRYNLSFFPPSTGFRVHVVEFPARGAALEAPTGVWPDSGLSRGFQRKDADSGMHKTDSVDVVVVLSGEIGLESESGQEVVLRPGDVVVQNGAMHAWRHKDVPCRVCFVNLGAAASSE
jgi:hypothetical protein